MKNSTQRNNSSQATVSQQKKLSFYEEHYILEPDDYGKDNCYFEYECDDLEPIYFSSYQLAI